MYDCGWTTGVVNEINITGLDLNNKLVVGNTKDGVMSLWQNDTKIEGKAGGIDVGLESLVYNRTAANNPRIYKIGIAGQGLTDEEIITLSSIINEYITSLGRNI